MPCEDKDLQSGKSCHEQFPTDPVLWCDDCQTEVAKAKVASGTQE